jgi:glutamine synthetase
VPGTILLADTSDRTVYPVFGGYAGPGMSDFTGAADVLLIPDPTTFQVLPWAPATAWVLCGAYFRDGRPAPFDTRALYCRLAERLADRGYAYGVGFEVQFHVFRAVAGGVDPRGAQDERLDALDDIVQLVRGAAEALDLGLRSVEVDTGPNQLAATFRPANGLDAADQLLLFRTAVRQVCRRNGLHATFMCVPQMPDTAASGWHLHQSLHHAESHANAFASRTGDLLSPVGRHLLAGLLADARAATVCTTPTLNGYKRYRRHSLAPYLVNWGVDNRGAMVRVIGGGDDRATRLENRAGEPAANPYLYLASQLVCGMDGMDRDLCAGDPTDRPYDGSGARLPTHLLEAVAELGRSELFAEALGEQFVDYLVTIKQAEIDRFFATVTDWEHQEYFDTSNGRATPRRPHPPRGSRAWPARTTDPPGGSGTGPPPG